MHTRITDSRWSCCLLLLMVLSVAQAAQLPTPTFSPNGGRFATPQQVILTCTDAEAEIHYTLNGSAPSLASPFVQSGATLLVDRSLTLKAFAYKGAGTASATRTAQFTMLPDCQPDLLINDEILSDTGSVGNNVYNVAASQSQALSVGPDGKVYYSVIIQNDGVVKDSFTVTGTAGDANWTVRYYDASDNGAELTGRIVAGTWSTGVLAVGQSRKIHLVVSAKASALVGAVKTLEITAVSAGNPTSTDTVLAVTTRKAGMSAVELTTSTSQVQVSSYASCHMTATPVGGVNPEFQFRAGYQRDGLWIWTILQDYSTSRSMSWRPLEAHLYTLAVYAREVGCQAPYQVYKSQYFRATPRPLTSVTLTTSLTQPQPVYRTITLTATPDGGANLEYKFRAGYQVNGVWTWTTLQEYRPYASCPWTPLASRMYTLVVYVREVGSTQPYDVYKSMYYTVLPN